MNKTFTAKVDVSGSITTSAQWNFLFNRQKRKQQLFALFTPGAGHKAVSWITGEKIVAAAYDRKSNAFYDRVEMNHPFAERRGQLRFRGYARNGILM